MGDGFYGGTPPWPQQQQQQPPLRMPPPMLGPRMTPASIAPVPKSCAIEQISFPHAFQRPRKRITSPADLEKLHSSSAGREFLGFVVALSESIIGHKLSDPCVESPATAALVEILGTMSRWVDEIPPATQSARYGNPAYREWHQRLEQQGPGLIAPLVPPRLLEQGQGESSSSGVAPVIQELFPYFEDSFGNATRIDYGTGHEANFAAFLLCLAKIGVFSREDYQALVSRVFVAYLDLMRKLQTTYWMEPAGSHGVWGLDDYHFLPFIFGAAQLVTHKHMRPKSIHNQDILDNFSGEFLYLGCVRFVKQVKKGPLAEHSPMIDDISGVASWAKVHSGMLKMYRAEVLDKVPIMQHFLFGSLIALD